MRACAKANACLHKLHTCTVLHSVFDSSHATPYPFGCVLQVIAAESGFLLKYPAGAPVLETRWSVACAHEEASNEDAKLPLLMGSSTPVGPEELVGLRMPLAGEEPPSASDAYCVAAVALSTGSPLPPCRQVAMLPIETCPELRQC